MWVTAPTRRIAMQFIRVTSFNTLTHTKARIQHRIVPAIPKKRSTNAQLGYPRFSSNGASQPKASTHSASITKPPTLNRSGLCPSPRFRISFPQNAKQLSSRRTELLRGTTLLRKRGWTQSSRSPLMRCNGRGPHEANTPSVLHPALCEATFPHPIRRQPSSR